MLHHTCYNGVYTTNVFDECSVLVLIYDFSFYSQPDHLDGCLVPVADNRDSQPSTNIMFILRATTYPLIEESLGFECE